MKALYIVVHLNLIEIFESIEQLHDARTHACISLKVHPIAKVLWGLCSPFFASFCTTARSEWTPRWTSCYSMHRNVPKCFCTNWVAFSCDTSTLVRPKLENINLKSACRRSSLKKIISHPIRKEFAPDSLFTFPFPCSLSLVSFSISVCDSLIDHSYETFWLSVSTRGCKCPLQHFFIYLIGLIFITEWISTYVFKKWYHYCHFLSNKCDMQ